MRWFILVTASFVLACATSATRLNDISLGMKRSQVMRIMGSPNSTKAGQGVEVAVYELSNCFMCDLTSEYWVVYQNGRVIQFGRAGDFQNNNHQESEAERLQKLQIIQSMQQQNNNSLQNWANSMNPPPKPEPEKVNCTSRQRPTLSGDTIVDTNCQ